MKNIVLIAFFFLGITTYAQNKNAKAVIEVDGVCMMCKSRIEKACLSTKGVKSANWNVETHELKLYYDEGKTDLKTIIQNITKAGHDTKTIKATNAAYNKLHTCCRYRDENVINEH